MMNTFHWYACFTKEKGIVFLKVCDKILLNPYNLISNDIVFCFRKKMADENLPSNTAKLQIVSA